MLIHVKHPLLVLSQELAALCQPLQLFHIHHLNYLRQFKDGSRISLSNNPQWVEDYYNLKLYESSFFEAYPTEYKSSVNVWMGDYDISVYHHGKQYYQTSHAISVTEPLVDGCEHFIFSTTPDKPEAIHYLSNNQDILFRFILYLKDKGQSIFNKSTDNKIDIYTNGFANNPLAVPEFLGELGQNKRSFYQAIPVQRYTFEYGKWRGITLTSRELSCIRYLLRNKTAQEMADLMSLSRRTVESYLENIKAKLNCLHQRDLVNELRKNHYLLSLLD